MSPEPETILPEGEAAQIQFAASRWVIDRHVCADWTAQDQAGLDAWLNAGVANKIAYLRAEHAWSRTSRAAALRQPMRDTQIARPERKFPFAGLKMAAALSAVVVVGLVAAQHFLGDHYTAYATPVGGREILTLSDGSQIELNTDSAVRIGARGNAHEVIVDKGEIYFDIRHDPSRRFTVLAAGRRITDLGTKFVVRDTSNRLEVALLEGRVRLEAPSGSKKPATNMEVGDVAVATAETTTVLRRKPAALSEKLSWRQGVLIFHHTTLADAAAEFNRYSNHKVVVADGNVAKLEINGKFRTNDVAMFADVAADVLGLHAVKQSDRILMTR